MGDQVKNIRKENEMLQKQITEVQKDLHFIKKGAVSNNQHGSSNWSKMEGAFR